LNRTLVSIIIPTYNRAHLISDTVISIQKQTFKNWELIIVDDGSKDNTEQVVTSFLGDKRIRYFKRPNDRLKGGNAARNYGYEQANGEFVKWLDSDDLLTPNCLEDQINALQENNYDVVFCRSRFFEENDETNKIEIGDFWHETFPVNQNFLDNFIVGKIRFCNNDGLWNRRILGDKPYNEILRNSQEFLMIIKHLSRNINVGVINKVLVLVRKHEDQMVYKRNYATFSKYQVMARYLAIRELKINNSGTKLTYTYLIKSLTYYLIYPLKRGEINFFTSNLKFWLKSLYIIYAK
jgi:glycosyltransferase involved in cell wall biosynthesis